MGIVNKFITTMKEESKEKKILTYYAKTYSDVLRFYDEINDCDRNLVLFKSRDFIGQAGKRPVLLAYLSNSASMTV